MLVLFIMYLADFGQPENITGRRKNWIIIEKNSCCRRKIGCNSWKSERQSEIYACLRNIFWRARFYLPRPCRWTRLWFIIWKYRIREEDKRPCSFCMSLRKKAKDTSLLNTIKLGTWHGTGQYKIETGDFIKPVNTPPAWSALVSERSESLQGRMSASLPSLRPCQSVRNWKVSLLNFLTGCLM